MLGASKKGDISIIPLEEDKKVFAMESGLTESKSVLTALLRWWIALSRPCVCCSSSRPNCKGKGRIIHASFATRSFLKLKQSAKEAAKYEQVVLCTRPSEGER